MSLPDHRNDRTTGKICTVSHGEEIGDSQMLQTLCLNDSVVTSSLTILAVFIRLVPYTYKSVFPVSGYTRSVGKGGLFVFYTCEIGEHAGICSEGHTGGRMTCNC